MPKVDAAYHGFFHDKIPNTLKKSRKAVKQYLRAIISPASQPSSTKILVFSLLLPPHTKKKKPQNKTHVNIVPSSQQSNKHIHHVKSVPPLVLISPPIDQASTLRNGGEHDGMRCNAVNRQTRYGRPETNSSERECARMCAAPASRP